MKKWWGVIVIGVALFGAFMWFILDMIHALNKLTP